MLYQLEQGPTEANIIKQSLQQKLPLPDVIANAPELEAGLEFFYVAFNHLMTCRNFNGIIPWSEIEMYARANEVIGDQKQDIHYFVRHLDNEFTKFHESKRDKKAKIESARAKREKEKEDGRKQHL